MPDVLERTGAAAEPPTLPPPVSPRTRPDERAARRSLLGQIARLEDELAQIFCSAWPRQGLLDPPAASGHGGPRLLALRELEEARDELAGRVHRARRALGERTYLEEQNRRLIEEMLLAPERHKWVRVGAEEVGEPGCKDWHVRPRWGLLGILLNWWRVRISSGCPLAGGRGPGP